MAVQRILRELESVYDLILWDALPILEKPDVLALGALIPNLVLVMESGRSSYEVLEGIKSQLAASNISLVGAILVKQKYRWLVE